MIGDWGNLGNEKTCVTFDGGQWRTKGEDNNRDNQRGEVLRRNVRHQ